MLILSNSLFSKLFQNEALCPAQHYNKAYFLQFLLITPVPQNIYLKLAVFWRKTEKVTTAGSKPTEYTPTGYSKGNYIYTKTKPIADYISTVSVESYSSTLHTTVLKTAFSSQGFKLTTGTDKRVKKRFKNYREVIYSRKCYCHIVRTTRVLRMQPQRQAFSQIKSVQREARKTEGKNPPPPKSP